MKNAVIYTRSANPNEQATHAQLEICRKYANTHCYNIVTEFSDNGYSGMTFNRPAFIAMNNCRDKWETLIVYCIDKLSRNSKDFYKYRKALRNEGKEIVSTVEPLSDDIFATIESLQEFNTYQKGVQHK